MSETDPNRTSSQLTNVDRGQEERGQGQPAGDNATGALSGVASEAGDRAKDVAGHAAEQLTTVAQQAKTQLSDLVGQTKDELNQQAQAKGQQAASALRSLSDQLQALSVGRPEEAGQLTSYIADARKRVIGLASTLEQRGTQGVLDDVARYARRKPAMFLLMAGVAGFSVGRLVRAGAAAGHEQANGTGQHGSQLRSSNLASTARGELPQSKAWGESEPLIDVARSASRV